jgi:hypothetical protein
LAVKAATAATILDGNAFHLIPSGDMPKGNDGGRHSFAANREDACIAPRAFFGAAAGSNHHRQAVARPVQDR